MYFGGGKSALFADRSLCASHWQSLSGKGKHIATSRCGGSGIAHKCTVDGRESSLAADNLQRGSSSSGNPQMYNITAKPSQPGSTANGHMHSSSKKSSEGEPKKSGRLHESCRYVLNSGAIKIPEELVEGSGVPSCTEFVAQTSMPTKFGWVDMFTYYHSLDGLKTWGYHTALVVGNCTDQEAVNVCVHDPSFLSEILGWDECDGRVQLNAAHKFIHNFGGVLIVTDGESRGKGLVDRMAETAVAQEFGISKLEAARECGLPADCREYSSIPYILEDLKIRSIRLLTNSPQKVSQLQKLGVRVVDRIPLETPYTEDMEADLREKAASLGHDLNLRAKVSPSILDEVEALFLAPLHQDPYQQAYLVPRLNVKALLMPQFYMRYAKKRIIPKGASFQEVYEDGQRDMRVVVDYPSMQRGENVRVVGFQHTLDDWTTWRVGVAMAFGDVQGQPEVPLRVHDACFTSEVLGSLKCDCQQQLFDAMRRTAALYERGIVVYLQQEGRNIGLGNKAAAYQLQEYHGLDTVDANRALSFPDDAREYHSISMLLDHLDIKSVQLITNNPKKVRDLQAEGILVAGRLNSVVPLNQHSAKYVTTKQARMGHDLSDAKAICTDSACENREEDCEAVDDELED